MFHGHSGGLRLGQESSFNVGFERESNGHNGLCSAVYACVRLCGKAAAWLTKLPGSRALGGRKGIYRDEQPIQILAVLLEQVGRIVPREELQRLREPGRHRVRGAPVRRSPVRTGTEYPIKLGTSSGRRDGAAALPLHEA